LEPISRDATLVLSGFSLIRKKITIPNIYQKIRGGRRKEEEGGGKRGRKEEEGGRRKEEGGRRKEEGGRRKERRKGNMGAGRIEGGTREGEEGGEIEGGSREGEEYILACFGFNVAFRKLRNHFTRGSLLRFCQSSFPSLSPFLPLLATFPLPSSSLLSFLYSSLPSLPFPLPPLPTHKTFKTVSDSLTVVPRVLSSLRRPFPPLPSPPLLPPLLPPFLLTNHSKP
jgi:hypothetical protein